VGTVREIEIPRGLAEVTPDWLSAALAGHFPGAAVAAMRPEPLHQGTASTWRLHLAYRDGAPGPATACIKSDFELPHAEHLHRSGIYRKEAVVYLDVLPKASARTPLCYAAGYDAEGRGFMLMQDVVAAGGRFCDPAATLSPTQVATGLEQLARLHASTWGEASLRDPIWTHHGKPLSEHDPFWDAPFEGYAERLKAAPQAEAIARVFRDREVMQRGFNKLRAFDDPIARSLIHGDAHVGNFFVDCDGDPGMADFQCVQRGHVSHDLAMFIASSLDVVDRRAHEKQLLEGYRTQLARLGVAAPDFDELWLGYRRHMIYALAIWIFTSELMQPLAFLVKNAFRYGMAALDLDTLGALE
jgi:aminoglycoside phosphotransferase (APT) family kinase protein